MNALLLTEHQKTQWTGRTKIYETKMMDDDYDKHYKLSTSLNTDSVMDNFVLPVSPSVGHLHHFQQISN